MSKSIESKEKGICGKECFFATHPYDFCVGLSKEIFGNEAPYVVSDMQFAQQTAFINQALLEKNGGELDDRA